MLRESSSAAAAHEHFRVRTMCGRDVQVGLLALGGGERPAWRISLDVGRSPGQDEGGWAGLTPAEARRLAAALLGQAAAAEREAVPGVVSEGLGGLIPVAPPRG